MQAVGTSFSLGDKVQLCLLLDSLGVAYIEGGFPGGSPKDQAFYSQMKNVTLKNSKLVAFGPTLKYGADPKTDPMMEALTGAGTECVAVFGKTNINHVSEILGVTDRENLSMIKETIKYLKSLGKYVFFDAEHYFSGYKCDREYALRCLQTAVESGADCVVLCDTVGGMLPENLAETVKMTGEAMGPQVKLGIHVHNDSGFADYSTVLACKEGASVAQVTLNGWGERCGNANLFTVVPNLQLRLGFDCGMDLSGFFDAAHKAAEIANVKISEYAPFVGKNAFSHKAGVHIDAVVKNPSSYEHIEPETVGNVRKFMLSEQSGKAAVMAKLNKLLPKIGVDRREASSIVDKIKLLEMQGYQFEGADASFEMLVKKILGIKRTWFNLNNYKVVTLNNDEAGAPTASAIVDVTVDSKEEVTAANGIGPVDALDGALRKALTRFYPAISGMRLIDYKVRVLESKQATASVVRVVIESSCGGKTWCTVGVSGDIIQASFNALVDSYEFMLEND